MYLVAIRGAITVENDTKKDILRNTELLLKEIMCQNNIEKEEIISVFFTATRDLTAVYPAVAARELGIVNAALMCANEMDIKNSLNMCIRVMVQANSEISQKEVKHIYLKQAKTLRPDITGIIC
ncbi:MAG: chorismate mutase [Clostridia bacterium]|nr:chorismate mutase [Clostridia bacterium]